jgi:hypothetical protein
MMFINHGHHDDLHICMAFGFDLLCDLLEMLNLINIGSAVATRRNLVDPIPLGHGESPLLQCYDNIT